MYQQKCNKKYKCLENDNWRIYFIFDLTENRTLKFYLCFCDKDVCTDYKNIAN